MEPRELIASERIKGHAIRLSQLELMIEAGNQEYQTYYNEIVKELIHASSKQLYFASIMLQFIFDSRYLKMSEIEQNIYKRSISILELIKEGRFTAHKESVERIIG